MSTDLVVGGTTLPANLAALFGGDDDKSDLSGGVGLGFPIMSIKGKSWTIVRGKERQVIRNAEGDPRASIEVVIIKGNKHLSKVFYKGGFVEGSAEKPTCYSNDGTAPAPDAVEKQSANCATCKNNQWGSRIGDGGQKGKACSDSRRLAIAPAGLLNDPMLLRAPAASLKPLMEYNEDLTKRNRKYNLVVTKLGFDPEAASPKLTFKYVRDVTTEEAIKIAESIGLDATTKILADGIGMLPVEEDDGEKFEQAKPAAPKEPVKAAAPPPAEKQAAPKAPPPADDDLAKALAGVLGDGDDD